MTIAIGILADDGIVIAADQQETRGGTKSVADKVLSVVAPHGVIAVTGAGEAGHLDAMAQQVTRAFIHCPRGDERQAVEASFDSFYAKHIVPLYPYNERFPYCDIEAIIGADLPSGRFLLANSQTALWECGGFVAVGIGAPQASLVLGKSYVPKLPIERAALLAAYAVYTVKETVEGCGKNTDVYMLRNGHCYQFMRWDQAELDRQFHRYQEAETVMLHHVLGSSTPFSNALPVLEGVRDDIAKAASKPRVYAPPAIGMTRSTFSFYKKPKRRRKVTP